MATRSAWKTLPAAGLMMVLSAWLGATDALAQGQFVENPVVVLETFAPVAGNFAWAVAELEDIDNPPDGALDLIMSAPLVNRVYVYSGTTQNLLHLLQPPGGTPAGAQFGWAIGDAGDVNNDGVNDIVVGAPSGPGGPPGVVYVFDGTDGSIEHTITIGTNGDRLGFGVGGAGDINGDDHDDIVVGAAGANTAYVFSGLDGSTLRTWTRGSGFGSGAAGAGDITGDGIPDQIIGAPGEARAYVFSGSDGSEHFMTTADIGSSSYGTFFVAGVGDVNMDGRDDFYVGDFGADSGNGKAYVYSGIDASIIHKISGGPGDGLGPGRGAGDVDGDLHADLILGHYTNSDGGSQAGKTIVYSGQTGLAIRTMTSTTGVEQFGFDAVGVGDVTGDGKIDYLVSAANGNRAYLIDGITELDCPVDLPDPPVAAVARNRTLAVSGGTPTRPGGEALRLTFVSLPAPFDTLDGMQAYVRIPSDVSENSGVSNPAAAPPGTPTFKMATLGCDPVYTKWFELGEINVRHQAIVPGATYEFQFIDAGCDTGDEANFSTATAVQTSLWGDVVSDCAVIPCGPPDGVVNITTDVTSVLDKFKNLASAPSKARADLEPEVLDLLINISDVTQTLDAFRNDPYPFAAGPGPCP